MSLSKLVALALAGHLVAPSLAEAKKKKAESYAQYNTAAVTEMFVNVLPQIANAVAAPLAKLDKITVVSTGGGAGDGTGTGASNPV